MKKLLISAAVIIMASLFVIIIFSIVSSFLKTEEPGFVSAGAFSFILMGIYAFYFPRSKLYLPFIIHMPLLLLLLMVYSGEGMKNYLESTLICIIAAYAGAYWGAWLNSRKKAGLTLRLRVLTLGVPLLIVVLCSVYLSRRNSRLDKTLIAVLDTIMKADQSMQNITYSTNSPEWTEWEKKYSDLNSSNMIKVDEILKKYGWPGEDVIGRQGSSAIWVTIQHSSLENQEKYLPLMQKAVKQGKARPSQLALLEDRILVAGGKEQIYGTQARNDSLGINRICPIKDKGTVNKRRFAAGLGPLKLYAKQLGAKL